MGVKDRRKDDGRGLGSGPTTRVMARKIQED